MRKKVFPELYKAKMEKDEMENRRKHIGEILSGGKKKSIVDQDRSGFEDIQELPEGGLMPDEEPTSRGLSSGSANEEPGFDAKNITDEQIMQISSEDPKMGKELFDMREAAIKKDIDKEKLEHKKFSEERNYQAGFGKDLHKETDQLREDLVKKRFALDNARSAIESGDTGPISSANLSKIFGRPELETLKGAQLNFAAKELLFSGLSRVSAKGQNMYMEKRISSLAPEVGKTREANLAYQEGLEAEADIDQAYLDNYDRLAAEDKKRFGFVNYEDLKKRALSASAPIQKQIMKRSAFRIKRLEEEEMGASKLKKQVGKNVDKGTPLTDYMMKLYAEKYGKAKGLEVAKKNGYYVPTMEEYRMYSQVPIEYRENIRE